MRIELKERYEEHVRIYFEKTRDAQIRQMLPQKCKTVEKVPETGSSKFWEDNLCR